MPPVVDVSSLADNFKTKVRDYEKIFALRMANGFDAKKDFVKLPIDQSITLTREIMGNVTQPGRTGRENPIPGSAMSYKQRKATLLPAKVDVLMGEIELYNLRTSWLANKQPADPTDINSIAGRDYIMSRLFAKTAQEVNAGVFRGALGTGLDSTSQATIDATSFQGGLNLVDGLGVKFTQGYATSGTGWVGDIPGANKVVSAATTFTNATAIAELTKLLDIIESQTHFEEFIYDDDPETPGYNFFMDSAKLNSIAKALDALTYKPDLLVEKSDDGDGYQFKAFPKIKIRRRRWMQGVNNIFGSPSDNLFYLHQNAESDIPKIKFEERGRSVAILIDWELAFDYADGRLITLWK